MASLGAFSLGDWCFIRKENDSSRNKVLFLRTQVLQVHCSHGFLRPCLASWLHLTQDFFFPDSPEWVAHLGAGS